VAVPLTRSRGAIDRLALGLWLKVFWHPLGCGMQRRQLPGLKRLVEAAWRHIAATGPTCRSSSSASRPTRRCWRHPMAQRVRTLRPGAVRAQSRTVPWRI